MNESAVIGAIYVVTHIIKAVFPAFRGRVVQLAVFVLSLAGAVLLKGCGAEPTAWIETTGVLFAGAIALDQVTQKAVTTSREV